MPAPKGRRIMIWALIAIVVLIGVPVIIGYCLPVRYEGRTTVEFDHDVSQVWDALQDIEAHPMVGKMMKSIEVLPAEDGRPAWRENMGAGEVITVTTTAWDPPRRMVRHMAATAARMTSDWEYELDPTADGCRVTLSGVTDIETGSWHTPIFRFMMAVGGGVKKGLDIQLDMVAASLDPAPESPGS